MPKCPCGTNKNYHDCCGRYISHAEKPETPEQLMRSRYSAYTQANMNYIEQTMRGAAANHFERKAAQQWATAVCWLGLEVLHSTHDQTKGYVEFIAHFSDQGKKDCIHELSEFQRINDQWYYVGGQHKR